MQYIPRLIHQEFIFLFTQRSGKCIQHRQQVAPTCELAIAPSLCPLLAMYQNPIDGCKQKSIFVILSGFRSGTRYGSVAVMHAVCNGLARVERLQRNRLRGLSIDPVVRQREIRVIETQSMKDQKVRKDAIELQIDDLDINT